ncbi:PREDICTED: tetratricopeptide repeat protein 22-like [Branchiostoma belcheri]|uniref:Tetratricopeptide repeat protein 22-like n=1 Tax=Branchiostoma belcheri TaxID=7741 RepID=A0A6P4YAM6_BRABE|nr:PREDICTED: tetratricopeptide repeat protein 22-like [Branchiostoma belcheri]
MAEQAFALTYDCFDKDQDDEGTEQTEKFLNAENLYQRAIKTGNGIIEQREKMTWSFFKAFNNKMILSRYIYLSVHRYSEEVKDKIITNLDKSIAGFTDVLHQEPTPLYKAQALVYVNCVMSRTEYSVEHMRIPGLQRDIARFKEQVSALLQEEGSVKHAIELAKDNHRVLNTMARALKGTDFEEAEDTIRMSLEAESNPNINWYGYLLNGELALERYKRTCTTIQSKRDPDNVEVLKRSISDLTTCVEGMKSSRNYSLLGEAFMKLALSESCTSLHTDDGRETEVYKHLVQALIYFNEALTKDRGARDPKVHGFRSECLERLKEDKMAIESWKRAVELDRLSTTYWGNIKSLLLMLLNQCRKMSDSEDFQPVVAETATYLKLALCKHETVYDKFMPALIEQFPEQFLHAANYFTITNDLTMAMRLWDCVDQTIGQRPLSQEIEERRRRVKKDIEDSQEALANIDVQEPRSSDHEQTADSNPREEGATGCEELEERFPATDEQKAFMPLPVVKARNTRGFHYDFFVIHSAKDEEWVNYTLLANLEGEHRLKGCIADRDFELGKYVVDNITAAIEESAKVLVILTPDMVQSKWCKHEMKNALHAKVEEGSETVIPVLLKDCEVPDEIKNITYLDARRHFDWDHLLRDIKK